MTGESIIIIVGIAIAVVTALRARRWVLRKRARRRLSSRSRRGILVRFPSRRARWYRRLMIAQTARSATKTRNRIQRRARRRLGGNHPAARS